MKVFSADYLNDLTAQAQGSPRKRQHLNIHESYANPCQRLFNAIEPNGYILRIGTNLTHATRCFWPYVV